MSEYIIHRDDELHHHGILGMHWGIRRFQNEDGTLTAAGKKRYSDKESLSSKSKKIAKSALGLYKEGDGNQFVSERRRANRKQELDEWNERKAENKKRSDLRKDLMERSKSAVEKAGHYEDLAYEETVKAREYADDAKALKKHYVAGKVGTAALMSIIGGMAVSAINDKTSGGDIDSGTFIRGALISAASLPINTITTGIKAGKEHKEAEKKYGLR